MDVLNFIIESIIVGFALYSIGYVIFSKKMNSIVLDDVDIAATLVIRFVGMYYGFSLIVYFSHGSGDPYEKYALPNRMFGPYWYAYWMYIMAYFISPQLLWIDQFRKSKYIRIIIALATLIMLSFERLIIFISSFNRDFIPSSWVMYTYGITKNVMLNRAIDLAVFGVVVWIVYWIRKKIKSRSVV